MSKQRAKGTAFENHVLETYLKKIWPKVERAPLKGVNDYGDFINVGYWLVEAKKRDRWDLPTWIRTILKKVRAKGTSPWVLVFAGDKRSAIDIDLVVLPAEQYFDQLHWMTTHYRNSGVEGQ
jgi:hypothetical protein